jgi:hypothetical protein
LLALWAASSGAIHAQTAQPGTPPTTAPVPSTDGTSPAFPWRSLFDFEFRDLFGDSRALASLDTGAGGTGSAGGGSTGPVISNTTVGYIDSAVPASLFRLRFEAGYNNVQPSRGEFFYSRSPTFPGEIAETRVDYQELSAYLEKAWNDRFSLFLNVPVRFLNPTVDANVKGLGDIDFGFKWAFYRDEDRVLTFQLRGYAPTGNGSIGLGTSHPSIEPSLLGLSRLTDRLTLESEFRVFVPLSDTPAVAGAVSGGASNFSSTILRYGIGLGFDVYKSDRFVVTPVTEVVGWTFLDGMKTINPAGDAGLDVRATGDTIVNVKIGARFKMLQFGDLYIGYGHALTDERMYQDILRTEFRLAFY